MAPPSSRSRGAPHEAMHFTPPRTRHPDTDSPSDTTHSATQAPDALLSRHEAVEKFAVYGRQHAHIDHLSGLEQDTTIHLTSTMLLQEDGQLAAKLDDVLYLVDGLLKPVRTPRARLAHTRSVLDLVQLVQDPQILQTVELSSQRCSIQNKLKLLLLTLQDTTDEMSRLSLAVLVYLLSKSTETEDYFDDQILAAIVHALKQSEEEKVKKAPVLDVATVKKCLKRKQLETLTTSTTQVLDEFCRMQLDEILQDHAVFYAGDELQVSVGSTLSAALYNLLQVDAPSCSSLDLTQRSAEGSFQRIQVRKRQLMLNGGLDVLALDLVKQVDRLEGLLPSVQTDKVTLECARSLHHLNMILRVFDQATFLTVNVQQYVSKQGDFLAVLLKLIKLLSELSWGVEAQKRWDTELSRMALTLEVLLSTLRVLLNLTHHNVEAADHVLELDGMQLLINAFSQLWDVMGAAEKQRKWEFDACLLLLSVMVNSIELSEENRDALAGSQVASSCGDATTSSRVNACDALVRFFLSKIESFKHLLDAPKVQDSSEAFAGEENDWSPEDVILGGCTSLLLGYLMKGSTANSRAVLMAMPDDSPRLLLRALGVFVAFHSQIGALTHDIAKSVLVVEKELKSWQESGQGAAESNLLGAIDANTLPGTDEHADAAMMDVVQGREVPPPGVRTRAMKNLCSNLDDSDDELQAQERSLSSLKSLEIGARTLTGTLSTSPGRKRPRAKSPEKTPVSAASEKSPMRARSSPIAVLPDGSLSSPVVARLLKRTRQLVEEFNAEFGRTSQSPVKRRRDASARGAGAKEDTSPPCLLFTMDVTCHDNGSDGLDLSLDTEVKDISTVAATSKESRSAMPSKRKTKPVRDPAKSAIASFDFFPSSTPSTPLRMKKGTALLQTPTRAGRSPDVYRQSPSLNLTPTKSSPSTPLRMKKTSALLQTPTPSGLKESPLSTGQHRRKTKTVRAPSTRNSSIFDFMD